MKFLPSEYKSVQQAIQNAGLEYTDFSFVKKRGRLNIIHLPTSTAFIFFRKKATILNNDLQWQETLEYQLEYSAQKTVVATWEETLLLFKEWLSLLHGDHFRT